MRLPRVYPIVDSAAWVRRLAPLGVHLVQLRIKE
ncbi:MAG: thiamine phosphate synthase, partial [Gammaproteobacteria bacterium]